MIETAPSLADLFAPGTMDNSFVRELPADSESANFRRQVLAACYSRVAPTSVAAPSLVAHSREMVATLGWTEEQIQRPETVAMLAGNAVAPGMEPFAACYGGHQFGHWARQLGDGRAISLAEVVTDSGRWELQLKGAGPTPYSRGADGRAVMRSSVREFLCSEAMFHLGVPTTRALSLVATGDLVTRDMFYDGRPADEPGAVVCRVAPSFLRFGNYELPAARQDEETLKALVAYTLRHHFPHIAVSHNEPDREAVLTWYREVCDRTADMIVHWQRVGFVHGVMNTDNMSILGLTIDYGPYGWLEPFDPHWTPNTTDAQGRRYRFGNQPAIAQWNLARLAEAIFPLVGEVEPLEEALGAYGSRFNDGYRLMRAQKLGLSTFRVDDEELFESLDGLLAAVETDMTLFYRLLPAVAQVFESDPEADDSSLLEPLKEAHYAAETLPSDHVADTADWLRQWLRRAVQDDRSAAEQRQSMQRVNPKYVPRNYLAQLAIDEAEQGSGAKLAELLEVMRRPYDEQPELEEYAKKRPEWARHRAGCSMLSCSS